MEYGINAVAEQKASGSKHGADSSREQAVSVGSQFSFRLKTCGRPRDAPVAPHGRGGERCAWVPHSPSRVAARLTAHCHPLRFQGPGHSHTKPKALQEQEVLQDLLIEVKWVMKVAGVRSRSMNG